METETQVLAARAERGLAATDNISVAASAPPKLARGLSGIIFYGLLAVIALAAVPYGTVEAWTQSLYGCLVLLLTILACVEVAVSRVWPRGAWLWLMLPLAGLLLLMLVQTIPWGTPSAEAAKLPQPVWWALSADPYETRRTAWRLLALMLTGALLFRYTDSPRRLRALVSAVIGITLVSAVFALARAAGQNAEGFILPRLPLGEKRAGQFFNRNHLAFMLEMGLGLLLGLLAARGLRREKWPLLVGPAFLLWAVLVFTSSRGGLLAFAAEIVGLALLFGFVADKKNSWGHYLGQSWVVRGLLLAVLLAGLSLGTLWLGGNDLASRIQQTSTEISNEQALTAQEKTNRLEIWRVTWQMFRDNPVLGNGFGAYWAAFPNYHKASGRLAPRQAHNDYLEILASGGLVGGALALCFLVLVLRQARQRLASHDSFRRAACFGALIAMFGVAVHSLMDFGLHITINTLLFICLIVIATAGAQVVDKNMPRREPSAAEAPRRLGTWAYAGAVAGIALCLWGLWSVGWIGFSRLLSGYARLSDGNAPVFMDAGNGAVNGTPNDPEAYSGRGLANLARKRHQEALSDFSRAAALRPRDYLMWLQLGRAYDIAGQAQAANAPLREAQRLAPNYAEPSWQLGNLLFRSGDLNGGFAEMRRAGRSNTDFLPQLADLAWGTAEGNVTTMLGYLQPQLPYEHLAAAQYLLSKQQVAEAAAQISVAGPLSPEQYRVLTGQFINAKGFREAYGLWAANQTEARRSQLPGPGQVIDGDFETDLEAGTTYFGWNWQKDEPGVSYARDPNQPQTGKFSFRLQYKNQTDPARAALSQLVALDPKTRYRLTFAARTKQLETAGEPTVSLGDAAQGGAPIGQAIISNSDGWRTYAIDFTTGDKTSGVVIYLSRQTCGGGPCAVFGTLWVDNFTLKKI